MFHDIGHGWTARPFGFPCNNSIDDIFDLPVYTEDQKSVLAMIDGKRDFFKGLPLNI